MKGLRIMLLIIHVVIGIGALGGGYACLADPINPAGASVELLKGSPFETFLIPGIVLFGLFGVGNCISSILLAKRFTYHGYIATMLGGAMIVWIIVQVLVIQSIVFLHILFFSIGAIQALIGLILLWKAQLFPLNQIPRKNIS